MGKAGVSRALAMGSRQKCREGGGHGRHTCVGGSRLGVGRPQCSGCQAGKQSSKGGRGAHGCRWVDQ